MKPIASRREEIRQKVQDMVAWADIHEHIRIAILDCSMNYDEEMWALDNLDWEIVSRDPLDHREEA